MHLEFHWQFLGQVQPDIHSRLVFPIAPRRPGLYRFRLSGNGPPRHYVGETEELRQRFQQYRTPGRTQQTNIRMNAEFFDHMKAGGTIKIDILVDKAEIIVAGSSVSTDLANKANRRLLEQAALVAETAAGTKLLNR